MGILDKINSAVSTEVLGEVNGKRKKKPDKSAKPTGQKKVKPEKEVQKQTKQAPPKKKQKKSFDIPDTETADRIDSMRTTATRPRSNGKPKRFATPSEQAPILEFLGISYLDNTETLVNDEEMSQLTFTLMTPTGYDPDEVAQFCDKVHHSVIVYQNIINRNKEAFNILLEHTKELAEKVEEERLTEQIANSIIDNSSMVELEHYKDRVIELTDTNNKLKQKTQKMEKEINQLKEELATIKTSKPSAITVEKPAVNRKDTTEEGTTPIKELTEDDFDLDNLMEDNTPKENEQAKQNKPTNEMASFDDILEELNDL